MEESSIIVRETSAAEGFDGIFEVIGEASNVTERTEHWILRENEREEVLGNSVWIRWENLVAFRKMGRGDVWERREGCMVADREEGFD